MKIVTNNVPRFTIDAYELSEAERQEFSYHDWAKIDAGEDSATFFRYQGQLYDLDEFERVPDALAGWDGYSADTFFSGVVVRYTDDSGEAVIVGRYMT